MKKFLSAILALLCCVVTSCSLWHDDLPPCDNGCYVHFVYDYNTAEEDRFDKLVGGLTVFVYDKDGNFVTSQAGPSDLLQLDDYVMHLDLDTGTYRLGCVAMQHPKNVLWQAGQHNSFRYDMPKKGDKLGDLNITLDRDNGVVDNGQPLDTLWATLRYSDVNVKDMEAVHDTLHLYVVPNRITVHMHNTNTGVGGTQATYSMKMTAQNGRLNITGDVQDDEVVTYHPVKTTVGTDDKGRHVESQVFQVSRIVLFDDFGDTDHKGLHLTVKDDITGDIVFDEPVAEALAKGNEAWATKGWSDQEYLDREHFFDIDIYTDGTHWSYAVISVKILNWSVRIQNMDL